MGKQLTAQEITDLLAGSSNRGRKRDTTEPRVMDNWWKQTHHILYRPDYDVEIKCANPDCGDPRPDDKTILLGEIKGTLMCRYCFLNGYLSNGN